MPVGGRYMNTKYGHNASGDDVFFILVPEENAGEAAMVEGLEVYPVRTLTQAVQLVTGEDEREGEGTDRQPTSVGVRPETVSGNRDGSVSSPRAGAIAYPCRIQPRPASVRVAGEYSALTQPL